MEFVIKKEKGIHGEIILRIKTIDNRSFFLPMKEKNKFIEELKKIKE